MGAKLGEYSPDQNTVKPTVGQYTMEQLKQKFLLMKSDRMNWETHWQEITDYMLTRKDTITRTGAQGEKKGTQLVDSTATQANETLAGALHGLLTNQSSDWFELSTGDDQLDNDDLVRPWLQDTVKRIHKKLNNTNFHTEVHEFYLDICSIATATMVIEEDDIEDLRFSTKFIKEIYICEDVYGRVYEVFRSFQLNAKQIYQIFGADSVPAKVKEAYANNQDMKFDIVHAVYPDKNTMAKSQYKFLSNYFILEDASEIKDPKVNKEGYLEWPYVVARWAKASGETYGRGPGMVALPEAKMINEMMKTVIRSAQKTIDPPLQAPDDGFVLKVKTSPASINYYRAGSNDRIEPIYNNARIDYGMDMLAQIRKSIQSSFYVDQLQLQQGPQMTATEVMQRTEEKMRLLGPMMGRMQSEFLSPLIDRVFAIMLRRNLFKDIPQKLSKMKLSVKFSSLVAKAQRINEAQNIFKYFQAANILGQIDPNSYQNIDTDAGMKIFANIYGLPAEMLRDKVSVQKIRQEQAKAQEQHLQDMQQQQQVDNASKILPAVADSQKQQA